MVKSTALYAAAAAALGIIGLAWDAFAFFWQPIPPDMPMYSLAAYAAGGALLIGSVGLCTDRYSKAAGWLLAAVLFSFSIPWIIRIVRFPQLFGTWGGFAEAFSLVVAAVILALSGAGARASRRPGVERACILVYGLCAIAFGFNHFTALPQTAAMVPAWIPPGAMAWAIATGCFHTAAGLAILSGVRDLLAARLLGVMMLLFSVLIWIPNLLRSPTTHMTWAGNAVNLLLAGAAFIVADAIRRRAHAADRRGGIEGTAANGGGLTDSTISPGA